MSQNSDIYFEEETAVKEKKSLKRPHLYKVLLHNDDYTPMDFVVDVLVSIFNKNETDATHIMLNVHKKGIGVAGVYTYEIAETKVKIVHEFSRQNKQPLKCSMERN